MGNVHTLDHDHTPVHGLPIPRERDVTDRERAGASQAAMSMDAMQTALPSRRHVSPFVFVLAMIGAGGGGGSIAAGIGAIGGGDVDALEQDIEDQDKRIDAHDDALETLRREQIGQHRWVASELIKQSRALTRIAEKVGAEVDVAVDEYQSGGM